MTNTSSNLPVCIHCGTARPADETLCPECGKPWIDVNVDDVAPVAAATPETVTTQESAAIPPPPPPLSSDDTGEFNFDDWTLPPERTKSKARWLIPLVLLIAVVAVWGLVFLDRGDTGGEAIAPVGDTTTTLATTTTQPPTTTTTEPPTTTTTAPPTTTTTVPYRLASEWEAEGEPIPVTELGLKASSIGPIALGSPITDVAGALVSTFGAPDAVGFDSGFCAAEEWYWLQWGNLTALFDGYTDDASFLAYRYESDGQPTVSPTLETLSGIRLGDSIEALQTTYSSYTLSFEVIDSKDHFRLSEGGDLLLWGPVSSTEQDGVIEGIYSPDPCQAEG